MRRYVQSRIPLDIHLKIMEKKLKLEKVAKELTGKQRTIPKTKVLRMIVNEPLVLPDELVKNMFSKKRRIL